MVRKEFITVTATTPPRAQFTAYPKEGTAPLAVTFMDLSRGYPSSRQWDFGDGSASTDENPVHTYEKPGKYTVTLTVTNDAGTDTAAQKNFITVTAKKQGTANPGDSGGKAGGEREKPDSSGSEEKPKIKLS